MPQKRRFYKECVKLKYYKIIYWKEAGKTGVNFTNILLPAFLYKRVLSIFFVLRVWLFIFG